MEILRIASVSVLSIFVLFVLTRLLGYRQLSELSLFDYVNGITIGSIAADLAFSENEEILSRLVAMIVYGLVTLLISFLTDKSITARKIITGKPYVLVDGGKLCYKNFKKARLDMNEFLMKCRNNGYFDLSQIHTAVLEPNGKVSFIPTALNKPVTASDIKALPQQETILVNVVIDGKIMEETLKTVGKDKSWLLSTLRSSGNGDISKIFLATCDKNHSITVYEKSFEIPGNKFE